MCEKALIGAASGVRSWKIVGSVFLFGRAAFLGAAKTMRRVHKKCHRVRMYNAPQVGAREKKKRETERQFRVD